MTIITVPYQSVHGRKPRPSQRGLWLFAITRHPGETTIFSADGTYSEASRAAKAEAKLIGGASKLTVIS